MIGGKKETEKKELKKTGKQYLPKYQLNHFSYEDGIFIKAPILG